MSKGTVFVISGPSGTGKGTVCNELVKSRDMYLSVSATSRDCRVGEVDGVSYHFISRGEFETLIRDNKVLEWNEYNGNYYGTPAEYIDKELENGRDVVLEIDPNGALNVKKIRPEAVLIFIAPPSITELKKRLNDRGRETEEQIQKRIKAAQWELNQAEKYNYIVVNDNLSDCVARVSAIMDDVAQKKSFVNKLLSEL